MHRTTYRLFPFFSVVAAFFMVLAGGACSSRKTPLPGPRNEVQKTAEPEAPKSASESDEPKPIGSDRRPDVTARDTTIATDLTGSQNDESENGVDGRYPAAIRYPVEGLLQEFFTCATEPLRETGVPQVGLLLHLVRLQAMRDPVLACSTLNPIPLKLAPAKELALALAAIARFGPGEALQFMARLPEHLQVECLEESARQLAPADIERAMMFACEINSRLQREHVLVEVATIASKRSAAAVARLGDRIFEPLLNDYAMFLQATSPGGPTGVDVQAFLAGIESPLVVRWTRLAISLSRSPDAATHGTALGPALVDERLAFQALQSVEKDHDQALTDALAIQDVDLRRQTALAVVRKILPTQPQKASFVLRTKLGLADPKQEIMSALMDVCDHHTVDLPGVFAELMPRLSPYGRLQILEYCCPSRPELVREYAEKYDVDVTMPMVACFVCTGLIQDDIATLMERLPENPYHDKAFGCEAVRRARANDVWLPHFEAISSSFIRAETRGRIAESLYRAGHPDQARREALEIELPQIRAQTLIRLIEMGDWSLDEALKAALSAITDVRQLTELAKLEAQARIINDNPVGALQAVRNVHEQQARMAVLRIIARSLSTKTLRHGIQMSSGVLVGSPRGQWCLALAERFLELHPRPEIGSEQE